MRGTWIAVLLLSACWFLLLAGELMLTLAPDMPQRDSAREVDYDTGFNSRPRTEFGGSDLQLPDGAKVRIFAIAGFLTAVV